MLYCSSNHIIINYPHAMNSQQTNAICFEVKKDFTGLNISSITEHDIWEYEVYQPILLPQNNGYVLVRLHSSKSGESLSAQTGVDR